ncbi:hypothetical protein D3C83_148530 [compost metagenome]
MEDGIYTAPVQQPVERSPVAHVRANEFDCRFRRQLPDAFERGAFRVRKVVEDDELLASGCRERHANMRADVTKAASNQ